MHTPGPWNWNKYGDLMGPACVCVIERESGVVDADAYLIASAPDLLAALKDVAKAYQDHFDVMPVSWQTVDNIVCAAIAKATGKE
jgi:hypothetical protein